jgi:hypothetical protein
MPSTGSQAQAYQAQVYKGHIHLPWREARLGHVSAQFRVSAGRQQAAQDHQRTRICLAGCAIFLLELPN